MVGTGRMAGRALLLAGMAALAAVRLRDAGVPVIRSRPERAAMRDVGIAAVVLLVGLAGPSGCDCHQGWDPGLDASVDGSVDAAVEVDAAGDAATDADVEDVCPEGESVLVADEGGETVEEGCWATTTLGPPLAGDIIGAARPEIAISGSDVVHVLFDLHDGHRSERRHVTNGAGFWQYELVGCNPNEGFIADRDVGLAVSSDGTVHVVTDVSNGVDEEVVYARKESDAWSREPAAIFSAVPSLDLALSDDEDPTVFVLAGATPGGRGDDGLVFARRDGVGVWLVDPLAADSPQSGREATLALGPDGSAYVVYEDSCPEGPNDEGDCPNPAVHITLDLVTNESGAWVSSTLAENLAGNTPLGLAVGPTGYVHCAYRARTGELVYGVRVDDEWSFEVILEDRLPSPTLAFALDAEGAVHLLHGNDSQLSYTTNRSGAWSSDVVTPLNPGQFEVPALAVDRDGRIHVAYVEGGGLHYATRTCP